MHTISEINAQEGANRLNFVILQQGLCRHIGTTQRRSRLVLSRMHIKKAGRKEEKTEEER